VRVSASAPALHLFVCANRRDSSPLGPGCSAHGDAVYDALKQAVAARGRVHDVWITKTHCLGICPKAGATVARYSSAPPSPVSTAGDPILMEVTPADASGLLEASARSGPEVRSPVVDLDRFVHELDALEELQREKVVALARRLKPGLTLEDVQNPHDFPELDDRDWHYADGLLAGIASVRATLRAILREGEQGTE
jgi:hypothetical protein